MKLIYILIIIILIILNINKYNSYKEKKWYDLYGKIDSESYPFIYKPQNKNPSLIKKQYIRGAPKSGTTLLEYALNIICGEYYPERLEKRRVVACGPKARDSNGVLKEPNNMISPAQKHSLKFYQYEGDINNNYNNNYNNNNYNNNNYENNNLNINDENIEIIDKEVIHLVIFRNPLSSLISEYYYYWGDDPLKRKEVNLIPTYENFHRVADWGHPYAPDKKPLHSMINNEHKKLLSKKDNYVIKPKKPILNKGKERSGMDDDDNKYKGHFIRYSNFGVRPVGYVLTNILEKIQELNKLYNIAMKNDNSILLFYEDFIYNQEDMIQELCNIYNPQCNVTNVIEKIQLNNMVKLEEDGTLIGSMSQNPWASKIRSGEINEFCHYWRYNEEIYHFIRRDLEPNLYKYMKKWLQCPNDGTFLPENY